jgi:hypothetical protein
MDANNNIVGVLVFFIGIAFVIRAWFRNRRLGKAEFPPDSPFPEGISPDSEKADSTGKWPSGKQGGGYESLP